MITEEQLEAMGEDGRAELAGFVQAVNDQKWDALDEAYEEAGSVSHFDAYLKGEVERIEKAHAGDIPKFLKNYGVDVTMGRTTDIEGLEDANAFFDDPSYSRIEQAYRLWEEALSAVSEWADNQY